MKYPGNFLSITKSGKLVVTVNQYGISELMSTWQGYFPNPWFNITYDGQGSVRQAICSGCGQVGDVCLKGSPLELDPRDAQGQSGQKIIKIPFPTLSKANFDISDAYSYWDITMVSGSLLQGWEVYFNLEDRGLLCLEFSGGELQPKLNDKNAFLTRQPDKRNCLFLITTY